MAPAPTQFRSFEESTLPLVAAEGMVIVDLAFELVACDCGAGAILSDLGGGLNGHAQLPAKIRDVLGARSFADLAYLMLNLNVGNLEYSCRTFLMEPLNSNGRQTMLGLHLKRTASLSDVLHDVAEKYHLTGREREALEGVSLGLTTKALAKQMKISPNTVNTFLRLIMIKMGTTTRAGVVSKVLEQLVEENSTWEEPEQERAAQAGDQVEIEMQTIRDGELVGEPFNRTGVLGKQELLEQIEQQVVGMQTNEEKDIEVVRSAPKTEITPLHAEPASEEQATLTASDEPSQLTEQALVQPGDNIEEGLGEVRSELAVGADVPAVETIPLEPEEVEQQAQAPLHYHIKLNSVKQKHSPALDDDFVASVSDLKTMDELTGRVRLNLLKQKQSESNREVTERFVREAVEQSHIEMPPILVNQQIHQLEEDLSQRLKQQKLTIDQNLSITGKSHADFHEDLRPQAEDQLKNQLVLLEIARAEGIAPEDVTEADIDEEINGFIEQSTQDAPEDTLEQQKQRLRSLYSSKEARDNIRGDVFSRKLGERLIELSTGLKPDSEAMQAAEATDAELDLQLKSDPNLASEASEVKEELTQGEIAE